MLTWLLSCHFVSNSRVSLGEMSLLACTVFKKKIPKQPNLTLAAALKHCTLIAWNSEAVLS